VKAVFFDVGGTLIHPWPSVGAVYSEVGNQFGFLATTEVMEHAFRRTWKRLRLGGEGTLTTSDKEWWRRLVFETLDSLNLEGSGQARQAYFEALFKVFGEPEAWRVFPDVVEALDKARSRHWHVGVISNWDSRLRPLLADLGLTQRLDSITVSCEVGAEKPCPKIFRAALDAASVRADEAVHIGDSYEEDVTGAEAVGMRAVLIERSGTKCPEGTVSDLRELVSLADEYL
jgi:putative hydrolase of the HAD superfamily